MNGDTLRAHRRLARFRKTSWVVGFLASVVVGVLVYRKATALPEYEGKPINVYLKDLKLSTRSPAYEVAVSAVKSVGPEAFDYYVDEVSTPMPWHVNFFLEKRQALPEWAQSTLQRWIDPYAVSNRKAGAIDAIHIIQDQIQDAQFTNQLVRLFAFAPSAERRKLAEMLNALGVNTVDLVLPDLGSTNTRRIYVALDVVTKFGSATNTNAIPVLSNILTNGRSVNARGILYALNALGEPAIPALRSAFLSDENSVQKAALVAFGHHREFLPAVVQLLNATDQELRLEACWKIVQLDLFGSLDESEVKAARDKLMRIVKTEFYAVQDFKKPLVAQWYIYQGGDSQDLLAYFSPDASQPIGRGKIRRETHLIQQIRLIQQEYDRMNIRP